MTDTTEIMKLMKIMKRRHSVRRYTEQPIEAEKRSVLDGLVREINQKADLHIQMIYDDPRCFDSFMAHYGKFSGVRNYIALVGKKSANSDEKLGYYGEEIVLKAEELGLNTCWVALTHGKSRADIAKGEKQVCLISIGYGETQGTPHKSKPMEDLCNYNEYNEYNGQMPEWFLDGMNAAMLAPTAMNQQKFRFELQSDGTVKANCGSGFYTKLDLGIVKYHFETVSGKKIG